MKRYIEDESKCGCKLLNYPYKNKDSILRLLCKCGKYFETSFSSFKCGKQQCDSCGGRKSPRSKKSVVWTISMMRQYIEEDSGSGCKLIKASRDGVTAIVTLQCPQCDDEYAGRFDKFRDWRHYLCDDCISKNKFNDVKCFVESRGCELVSDSYATSDDCLVYKCSCGNEFSASFNAFKNVGQQKCKECSYTMKRSLGETTIHKHLKLRGIKFKSEYSFENCRNDIPLRFDFAVLNEDKVKFLIEYDGEQHYMPVRFGGISKQKAKSNYKNQKQNDKIKNQYCKSNNILLLRIPYWDFENIELVLDKWLESMNDIGGVN